MGRTIPWLPETGEMAKQFRSIDWSKTSLGPVEKWPDALKTTIGLILNNKFPMMIMWGPKLLTFYNDAFCPILRDKPSVFLGVAAPEQWEEIWDFAGPLVDAVKSGREPILMNDRQLFIKSGDMSEEAYFTFCLSPIITNDGRIEGVLNTVQETTAKVLSERQTRMLHELAIRTICVRSEGQAYRNIMNVLSAYKLDIPFALLFRYDSKQEAFHLSGATGLQQYEGPLKDANKWPLLESLRLKEQTLVDISNSGFGLIPKNDRGISPGHAVVLPLLRPETGLESVLVIGLSPHRKFDEAYKHFFATLLEQVATVIVNAHAFEIDREKR